jgi:hypothetical protein
VYHRRVSRFASRFKSAVAMRIELEVRMWGSSPFAHSEYVIAVLIFSSFEASFTVKSRSPIEETRRERGDAGG